MELVALLKVLLIIAFTVASIHTEDLRTVLLDFALFLAQRFDFFEFLI